jgi:hypothetical protein
MNLSDILLIILCVLIVFDIVAVLILTAATNKVARWLERIDAHLDAIVK